jgi:hypothetical protein
LELQEGKNMWKKKHGKILSTVIFCLLMITVQACHTMKFEIANIPHEKVVEDTNWFFLFGWFPTREIDVSSKCPTGVTAIKEQTTARDVVILALSIYIATPRTSWYYCMPEKPLEQKPAALLLKEGSK